MTTTIPRCFLFFIFFIASHNSTAQDTVYQEQSAQVLVNIIDSKGKPWKGEVVLFRAEENGKLFSGRSDAQGKFNLSLPAGYKYIISVKAILDTSKYGMIDIPRLEAGQFYSVPFTVNIRYDPARTYTLDNVHFDFGKATLRPESYTELKELKDYLVDHPAIRVEIAGHTDNIGNDADNLKLSQQRAASIRDYLLKIGITPDRVTARGYGASQPVADNATEEGRQLNRRTEVRIL